MGHKRYGFLPKTKAWRLIVSELADFTGGDIAAASIAQNTLQNVYDRFYKLQYDPSFQETFETLLKVSFAFQNEDPVQYLAEQKILSGKELSVLKIASAIANNKSENVRSEEYSTFAKQAAIDAVNNWYVANLERGETLFSDKIDVGEIFYKSSNGTGFCELARLYFSKFTERYLKYFLEREASAVIPDIKQRNNFNNELEKHIKDVSRHAFESAKITESYSAGWYNKYVRGSYPEKGEIKKYIAKSFGKLRSELLEEKEK